MSFSRRCLWGASKHGGAHSLKGQAQLATQLAPGRYSGFFAKSARHEQRTKYPNQTRLWSNCTCIICTIHHIQDVCMSPLTYCFSTQKVAVIVLPGLRHSWASGCFMSPKRHSWMMCAHLWLGRVGQTLYAIYAFVTRKLPVNVHLLLVERPTATSAPRTLMVWGCLRFMR